MSTFTERASGAHTGCSRCGGMLQYVTKGDYLKCLQCSAGMSLTEYDELFQEEGGEQLSVVEYSCPQCGASLHTTQTNMVSYCSFCGSEVMFRERMTNTRRPDWIVPFQITREECEKIYAKRMEEAIYAPASALDQKPASHFQPIYVPYYYYREQFSGEKKFKFTEKTITTDYEITNHYESSAKGTVTIEGEVQCASSQFEPDISDRLQLSTKDMKVFRPGYLCGSYAEAPDLDPNEEKSSLEPIADHAYGDALVIKMDRFRKEKTKVEDTLPEKVLDEVELVLMPVWLLAQKGKDRVLYTAINGIDGTVVCDTPVEAKKTFGLALLLGLAFAVFFLLLNSIFILRGKLVAGLCSLIAHVGFLLIYLSQKSEKIKQQEREEMRTEKTVKLINGKMVQRELTDRKKYKWYFADLLVHFVLLIPLPLLIAFFSALITNDGNAVLAGLVSDRGWLPPFLCLYNAIFLGLCFSVLMKDRTYRLLYVAETALIAGTFVLMLLSSIQVVYYVIAAVMMLILIIALVRLTKQYNQYVTRPVPFFSRKEDGE